VQVGTGESKLLLFETFWLYYYYFFFFTRAIPRGARAPKKRLHIPPSKFSTIQLHKNVLPLFLAAYLAYQNEHKNKLQKFAMD